MVFEGDVVLKMSNVLRAARGKVVQHRYVVAECKKLFRQMRPDKTGPAGDESPHHSPAVRSAALNFRRILFLGIMHQSFDFGYSKNNFVEFLEKLAIWVSTRIG